MVYYPVGDSRTSVQKISKPKTEAGIRAIPMLDTVYDAFMLEREEQEENGFNLNKDKYNWEEHPDHFILQDADQPIDFGEGKKNIYALEGTEVLVQRNREVQMAAHDFGKGRAVYISGVPYSFANSRTLYRAILWSAHSEEELHTWFSSNYNVEVHAYVKNGKYCVVNNTYEPQDTTVYTTGGNHFDLHLEANEIKWYEI